MRIRHIDHDTSPTVRAYLTVLGPILSPLPVRPGELLAVVSPTDGEPAYYARLRNDGRVLDTAPIADAGATRELASYLADGTLQPFTSACAAALSASAPPSMLATVAEWLEAQAAAIRAEFNVASHAPREVLA